MTLEEILEIETSLDELFIAVQDDVEIVIIPDAPDIDPAELSWEPTY